MIQAQAIGAVVIAATAFGAGWKVQGWRWDASLRQEAENRVAATNAARAREHELANAAATIAQTLEKDKADALRKKDRIIADLRAGAIGLRLPMPVPDSGSPPAAAGKCDGRAAGELPREVAEFLLGEAARADEVTKQLAACQAVLRADRK